MEPFLRMAVDVAESSPSRKKVGAVLMNKNKVIATATNHDCKSHPLQAKWADRVGLSEKIYLHAEMSAMIKARDDSDKIVVVRLGGHSGHELRQSRPCPICESYLKHSGIEHVYYSTGNNKFTYEYWGK
jgi:tRNA(Arg) A34 adenosine deaminase TadA